MKGIETSFNNVFLVSGTDKENQIAAPETKVLRKRVVDEKSTENWNFVHIHLTLKRRKPESCSTHKNGCTKRVIVLIKFLNYFDKYQKEEEKMIENKKKRKGKKRE